MKKSAGLLPPGAFWFGGGLPFFEMGGFAISAFARGALPNNKNQPQSGWFLLLYMY